MIKLNTNNFDFLRVVFASIVAIAHLLYLSNVGFFQDYLIFFNTRLAIDGFFIISGFLIAKSYENSQSLKVYFIRRVKRIVPAYAFLIFLCAISFSLISLNSFFEYFTSSQFWKYLIANLTFQNYLEPCLPGVFTNNILCAVNGALWTIKIEEAFYLLIPVFYWLIKVKKVNLYLIFSIVYIGSVLYFNYFLSIDMYRIAKQLPGAFSFFIVGIFFYKNFSFFYKWKHYFILPSLILFILEQFIFKTQFLLPISFGFVVYYIAYNFKFLNNFGKYGDFTYGIYIYHFPLIQLFVHFNLFNKYNPILISLFLIVLLIILAITSWNLLELKFLSKNRRLRQKQLLSNNSKLKL